MGFVAVSLVASALAALPAMGAAVPAAGPAVGVGHTSISITITAPAPGSVLSGSAEIDADQNLPPATFYPMTAHIGSETIALTPAPMPFNSPDQVEFAALDTTSIADGTYQLSVDAPSAPGTPCAHIRVVIANHRHR